MAEERKKMKEIFFKKRTIAEIRVTVCVSLTSHLIGYWYFKGVYSPFLKTLGG